MLLKKDIGDMLVPTSDGAAQLGAVLPRRQPEITTSSGASGDSRGDENAVVMPYRLKVISLFTSCPDDGDVLIFMMVCAYLSHSM